MADALRRHRTELAAWEILECGKQWREADADVTEAIDFCEDCIREGCETSAMDDVVVNRERTTITSIVPEGSRPSFPLGISRWPSFVE